MAVVSSVHPTVAVQSLKFISSPSVVLFSHKNEKCVRYVFSFFVLLLLIL